MHKKIKSLFVGLLILGFVVGFCALLDHSKRALAQQPGCTVYSLTVGCYIYPQAVLSVPQILPDGGASAPSLAWANAPTTGIYRSPTGNLLNFVFASVNAGWITNTGLNGMNIGAGTAGTGIFTILTANSEFRLPRWATIGRPTSPTVGETGWNTTLNNLDSWNGSAWVQPATSTGALLAINNLSDVASAATSRSNLGLGTAATKATSGSGGTVASTTGSFTAGDLLKSNDTSGTLQDTGIAASVIQTSLKAAAVVSFPSNLNVSNGTYPVIINFPWSTGTITSVSYLTNGSSPSFAISLTLGGSAVAGCTATVTSATLATTACTASNSITAGEEIDLLIASTSGTPNQAAIQINYTHSPS